jgi:hypothetical protein
MVIRRPRQRDAEQLPDQLHRKVLEGQRRPMEQLQQEMVRPQLHHRCPRPVPEPRIGAVNRPPELRIRKRITHEGPHHPERDLLIRQPRQRRDLARRHHRHAFRHIQPAVAGEPRQHRLAEPQHRGGTARGHIAHQIKAFTQSPA